MRKKKSNNRATSLSAQDRLCEVLNMALAILGGLLIVARPLANQFAPYTPDAAFAGLLTILFVVTAGLRAVVSKEKCAAPEKLVLAVILWTALFVFGALQAPNMGTSIPLATDAILYALVLLAGYFAGRSDPRLRSAFIRASIAMIVVVACAATWQVKVDFPRMRHLIATGETLLPDSLNSKIGLDRFNGDDAFATFGNPNSLAAYLLVGFFLLLGHTWDSLRIRPSTIRTLLFPAIGALLLVTLYWTGSKGGGVALVFGCGFFAVQRLNTRFPILNKLAFPGVAIVLVMLVLGLAGIVPSRYYGLSMQVRFDYWTSALAMFIRHPLQGVGVGGFGEWYSIFKTPMGWEVKDPHNEFVSLLAELGVLGPIFYGLIWWLVLRNSRASKPFHLEIASITQELQVRDPDFLVPTAGAFAWMFFILAFGVFNASDVFSLFQGAADRLSVACALETLVLPILFLLVFAALRWDARMLLKNESQTTDDSNAMLHGYRAAAGAILMHQLVDFDFKAQAVMISLFAIGGLFWGESDASQKIESSRTCILSARSGWLTAALGLLLIPTAFWIPFYSGVARTEAQDLQSYLQLIATQPEKTRSDLSKVQAKIGLVEASTRAFDVAPFDPEAANELIQARIALAVPKPFESNEREILLLLEELATLRPLWPQPHLSMGSLYLRRGQAAPDNEKRSHFNKARDEFAKARALYPLHPGFAFMEGDAWLLMDEPSKACGCYGSAYEIDMRINDPNVCIAAIYYDPRPGISSRHGLDTVVLESLKTHYASTVVRENPKYFLGFLARQACATANVLNEIQKRGSRIESQSHAADFRKSLREITSEMSGVPADLSARAHAAFLCAICVKNATPQEVATVLKDVESTARKLQLESMRHDHPGTVPRLFNDLIGK